MANYYVTVAGGGDNSGDSWANSMTISEFKTSIENNALPGDSYFVMEGTYTVSSEWSSVDSGNATSFINIIGVKSGTTAEPPTQDDWAYGSNRPEFIMTSYIWFGSYKNLRNFIFAENHYTTPVTITSSIIDNCKFSNSYNSSTVYSVDINTASFFTNNEVSSDYGRGLEAGSYNTIYCNYIHDCVGYGIIFSSINDIMFNIINSVSGIGLRSGSASYYDSKILHNTIYNCGTGISLGSGNYRYWFLNNIISDCDAGFICDNSGTVKESLFFDYNNWYNNTIDMSWDNGSTEDNSAKGLNSFAVNPNFTDAANGDFSLVVSDSALINVGFGIQLGVG